MRIKLLLVLSSIALGFLKNPVAAVLTAAHNEIGDGGLAVVGGAAQDDAAARIGMVGKDLLQIMCLHSIPPLL